MATTLFIDLYISAHSILIWMYAYGQAHSTVLIAALELDCGHFPVYIEHRIAVNEVSKISSSDYHSADCD